MKIVISLLAVFLFVVEAENTNCKEGPLQDNINFEKLSGNWDQAYYSPGTVYDDAICVESSIYDINTEESTVDMTTTALVVSGAKKRPETQIVRSTAYWGDDNEEENIKNHIVTDYENYLIFYACSNGRSVVDVRVRQGKPLPLRKIREVAELLDANGIDFFSLRERPYLGCQK